MLFRGIRRFLCLVRRGDLSEKQLGRRFQQVVAEAGCQCVDEEIVSTAIQFILQNAQKSVGVDEVAAAACTSRRTLETRFEQHLGRTVSAEIRRVRIDHAKRLLAGSKMSIAQIAQVVGFGTAQYMARVFRREADVSPSEYRRQFADG
ncbi:MAG: helix-turn-helix transcriptional regulator [Candidatus Nealsonbacteria bacterium]|nr:helix-turn-helix transcriptional regulator [Candidatus Nealsonbacteria bacterium]